MDYTMDYTQVFQQLAKEAQETKGSTPWCQVIQPPRGNSNQVEQMVKSGISDYGIFITQDQADNAGLNPDLAEKGGFKKFTHTFSNGVTSEGYLSKDLCFYALGNTGVFVEEKINRFPYWEVKGPAYNRKGLTSWGEKAKNGNRQQYRLRSRHFLALCTKQGELITEVPVKISLSGGAGATFGQEFRAWQDDLSQALAQNEEFKKAFSQHSKKAKRVQVDFNILRFFFVKMSFGYQVGTSNFLVPVKRDSFIVEQEEKVERDSAKKRVVSLSPTKLEDVLNTNGERLETLSSWREEVVSVIDSISEMSSSSEEEVSYGDFINSDNYYEKDDTPIPNELAEYDDSWREDEF